MRAALWTALLGAALAGCAPAPTQARGKPLQHWLTELRSPDPRARKTAVEVLGNVGPRDPAALPALAGAVRDPDPSVRDAAILALLKSGPAAAEAAAALREALHDPDETVRAHAAAALRAVERRE